MGYQFTLNVTNRNNGTTNWRCINRSICSGSITLNKERNHVLMESKHHCKPNMYKNKVDKRLQLCRNRVKREFKQISKIYDESMNSFKQ